MCCRQKNEERMNNLIWDGDGMRNIGLVGRISRGGLSIGEFAARREESVFFLFVVGE